MQTALREISEEVVQLREDGEKRKAVRIIIENKLDPSDFLHAMKATLEVEKLVNVITLFDSVIDEMRDTMKAV